MTNESQQPRAWWWRAFSEHDGQAIEQRIDRTLSTLFRYIEKLVLVAIGGFALLGIGDLIFAIVAAGSIRLEDLLLMFIYIEIMAMANAYFQRRAVPFAYPMFIAVTALSRLIVLQGKNIAPENLLYEGGAILLVALAILVVRYSERYRADLDPERPHGP